MGKIYNIENGHTLEEYEDIYGYDYENGDLWDFDLDEVVSGAVDLHDDMVYWCIDGRVYETNEYIEA